MFLEQKTFLYVMLILSAQAFSQIVKLVIKMHRRKNINKNEYKMELVFWMGK